MANFLNFFKGKKTYFVAASMGVLVFARQMGWIDEQTYNHAAGVLAAAGVAALRSGLNNSILPSK